MKSCLIFSISTIPFNKNTFVDGAGMRSWFLAKGLKENGINVTIVIPEGLERPKKEINGIKIQNWELNSSFKEFMNSFDSLLIQYTRPDVTNFVVDNLKNNVQLIVDLYIPAYVEVSARDSLDRESEFKHFLYDVNNNWNRAILKGNLFIHANKNQEMYYEGVLSALGRLNPVSYDQDFLIEVPLGVQEKDYNKPVSKIKGYLVDRDSFVIGWFGSLYPWFDIKDLIYAVGELNKANKRVKLVIIGGKPKNSREDFNKQYKETVQLVQKSEELKECIIFVDWVKYSERFDWFKDVDLFVLINKKGRENKYSWRTRTTDMIASEKAILTNGGDPIGEMLIENNAAFRLTDITKDTITKEIKKIILDKELSKEKRKNLIKIKNKLTAKALLSPLANKIKKGYFSPDLEEFERLGRLNNKQDTLLKKIIGIFR